MTYQLVFRSASGGLGGLKAYRGVRRTVAAKAKARPKSGFVKLQRKGGGAVGAGVFRREKRRVGSKSGSVKAGNGSSATDIARATNWMLQQCALKGKWPTAQDALAHRHGPDRNYLWARIKREHA